MGTFRPMLAADALDASDLQAYFEPMFKRSGNLLVSMKLDGIRAVMKDGQLVSRTLKPIRNRHTQELFKRLPDNIDGELIVGSPKGKGVMSRTSSGVMSEAGEPDVTFYVFDHVTYEPFTFMTRLINLAPKVSYALEQGMPIQMLTQYPVKTYEELMKAEEAAVEIGYEGLIVRDPNALYKFGRSTLREGGMLKYKRFKDDEAEIVGFYEMMHNENAPTTDERGYTKRSSHKDGKVASGMLGGFTVKCKNWPDVTFDIGSGFDHAARELLWMTRDQQIGKIIKFKYMPYGSLERPRAPIFLGFRHLEDIS